ncbi:MAG: TonB-dependent receptor plug domain-containing protein [Verrucomicrobiota bacterium]
MNRYLKIANLLLCSVGFVNMLPAQTTADRVLPASASTPAEPKKASEETLVLSPFTVTSSQDVGFVAANALAGGRMATALKDTPVAYSVQTSEFLEAFNLTDVAQAAQWTVNANHNEGDGTYKAFGTTAVSQVNIRGIRVNSPTVNFFPTAYTLDGYNIDRIDYARGPNAVLFGAGGIGATVNTVTKQAIAGKTIRKTQALIGSYGRRRLLADINEPFAGKKGAVRANFMWEDADTWRNYEWTKRKGVALATTYQLTPNLSIRAGAEYIDRAETKGLMTMTENISGWDGKTSTSFGTLGKPIITGTTTLTTALSTAQRAAFGVGGGASAGGVSGTMGQKFVTSTLFGADDEMMNMQRYFSTAGASQNSTLANSGRINGVAIITPGVNLASYAMIDGDQFADRYTLALAGSPYFSVPNRSFTPLWANKNLPTFTERAKNGSVVLNYTLGKNLFFQVAGNANRVHIMGNTAVRRGSETMLIDINKNLPNGNVNPGYLHPYVEYLEYRNPRDYANEGIHLQGVYKKDTKIGKFQLSVIGGGNNEATRFRARTLLMPVLKTLASGALPTGGVDLDARTWLDGSNSANSEYGVWNRLYLDQPNRTVTDPSQHTYKLVNGISGITETVKPTWMYDATREDNNRDTVKKYHFFQTAGNLDLFNNRLVLIGAFRRDFTYLAENRIISSGDEPVGWNGNTLIFRGDAPKDYFDLMYQPKSSTGVVTGAPIPADVRPRTVVNGVSIGQSQYATDRFKNDYNAPALHPNINTFTLGGVVNVTPSVGMYYNVSQSFSLVTASPTLDGSLLPPTASQGTDYGIRYTLPNGKLSLSAGKFISHQAGAAATVSGLTDYNNIYSLAPLGPTAAADATLRNTHNLANFPVNVYDTSTAESSGYEFELTANPLRGLRITANAGFTDTYDHDKNPRLIAYFASADAMARTILAEGGILISAANVATTQAIYTDPTAPGYSAAKANNSARSSAAAVAWNDLQTVQLPNSVVANLYQPRTGINKWGGNLATDYTFQSGRLKQLRIGGGVRMRTGQVVGFRGSDTIVDPNDPTKAIDDPTVDATTPVIAKGYTTVTGSLHYQFRLKNKSLVQIDLFVDNLLNNTDPIFSNNGGNSNTGNTVFAPRSGSITDPSRVTIPGVFTYLTPRNYTLAAKVDF